jgi:hypothetical protein
MLDGSGAIMKLVTVAKYFDEWEAGIAQNQLADNGIEAVVIGGSLLSAAGRLPLSPLIEVQVSEELAEKASKILKGDK